MRKVTNKEFLELLKKAQAGDLVAFRDIEHNCELNAEQIGILFQTGREQFIQDRFTRDKTWGFLLYLRKHPESGFNTNNILKIIADANNSEACRLQSRKEESIFKKSWYISLAKKLGNVSAHLDRLVLKIEAGGTVDLETVINVRKAMLDKTFDWFYWDIVYRLLLDYATSIYNKKFVDKEILYHFNKMLFIVPNYRDPAVVKFFFNDVWQNVAAEEEDFRRIIRLNHFYQDKIYADKLLDILGTSPQMATYSAALQLKADALYNAVETDIGQAKPFDLINLPSIITTIETCGRDLLEHHLAKIETELKVTTQDSKEAKSLSLLVTQIKTALAQGTINDLPRIPFDSDAHPAERALMIYIDRRIKIEDYATKIKDIFSILKNIFTTTGEKKSLWNMFFSAEIDELKKILDRDKPQNTYLETLYIATEIASHVTKQNPSIDPKTKSVFEQAIIVFNTVPWEKPVAKVAMQP